MREPTNSGEPCIGIVAYTGSVFHGTSVEPGDRATMRPYPYADTHTRDMPVMSEPMPDLEDYNLGSALYTTPASANAAAYAELRARDPRSRRIVELLLEQVRLYDFRDMMDPARNADVSLEMAQAWRSYFNANVNNLRSYSNGNYFAVQDVQDYQQHLENFIYRLEHHQHTPPELGDLSVFGLLGTQDGQPGRGYASHPAWGGLWVRFLMERYGVEGQIAVMDGEAGVGWRNGKVTTVALSYLTDKILSQQIEYRSTD